MKRICLFLLYTGVATGLFAMGSFDESSLETKPAHLTSAQVTQVFPLKAKAGSMVFITGKGLGSMPVPLFYGQAKVTAILAWTDTLISFRLPTEPATEPRLIYASEEGAAEKGSLIPIPGLEKTAFQLAANSYTVRWVIPLEKARSAARRDLKNLPPLEIVLDKTLERFPLIPDRSGNFLYTEAELPMTDNPALLQAQRYSIRAVTGESKEADLLTQLWAKNDPFPVFSDEPAFYPGNQDSRWDPKTNRLNLVGP